MSRNRAHGADRDQGDDGAPDLTDSVDHNDDFSDHDDSSDHSDDSNDHDDDPVDHDDSYVDHDNSVGHDNSVDLNAVVGSCDIALITLDTLRYDVAQRLFLEGRTPTLARHLPACGWEERHAPGNFTYAAHAAIFAGFFPTPARPGVHPRPFAVSFAGSSTITAKTCVFDAPDIVTGLAGRGYHTACIGGVGFFNKQNPIGSAFPSLFDESHWEPAFGVTDRDSTRHQIDAALVLMGRLEARRRLFLFINVSALHQPNRHYLPGATRDSIASHAAALEYVDGQLGRLFDAMGRRAATFVVICADHGTAYGEDGYTGHRLGHEVVWTVPYAELLLSAPA